MPEQRIAVTARIDELDKLGVRHQPVGDREVLEIDLVPGKLIIETKSIAVVADLVDAAFYFDETTAAVGTLPRTRDPDDRPERADSG